MFTPTLSPTRVIRSPQPRLPRFSTTVMLASLVLGLISLLPETVISAPVVASGVFGDLGAPLARVAALRLPALATQPNDYQPLPRRSAELNALLEKSVDVLTHGEAMDSRNRLLALQADLHNIQREISGKRLEILAAGSCVPSYSSLSRALSSLRCEIAPSSASLNETIRDLEGTVRQRQLQILAERDRFTAELQTIGLNVKAEQVDGLLHLASASDLIGLKSAYTNLQQLTEIVRDAVLKSTPTPAMLRRYYGLYTVLLEVAMHMHEEMYFKLENDYLPRLDAIAGDTITTFRQAERLKVTATRVEYGLQLDHNMRSLTTTLRAAQLYRAALVEQAKAIDSGWRALRERHQVAVNSWRSVNLSSDLLVQMQGAGQALEQLNGIVPPTLQQISSPALQQEFNRLTSALIIPNS